MLPGLGATDGASGGGWALLVLLLGLVSFSLSGCEKPYRVGEHVLVAWEGQMLSGYITQKAGRTRYRVHFEAYDCELELSLERIVARVEQPAPPPPPSARAPCGALSIHPKTTHLQSPVGPYQPGDRVRVTWRGSVYPATVLEVVAKDRFLIHYEGFENAWDETVTLDRILSRQR